MLKETFRTLLSKLVWKEEDIYNIHRWYTFESFDRSAPPESAARSPPEEEFWVGCIRCSRGEGVISKRGEFD